MPGFLLSASGFRPNTAQTPEALFTIRLLVGGMPLVCFVAGTLVFSRFRLTRSVHAEIPAVLDQPPS